ncbi:DUF4375 domain-containing protein [Thermodesulfobacteriota bacterium]
MTEYLYDIDYDSEEMKLCGCMSEKIWSTYDDSVPITNFSDKERVVMLVWDVFWRVENGGFYSLFEESLPGDPSYRLALEAYKEIGSQKTIEAFQQALDLFPNGEVPVDAEERIKLYGKIDEDIHDQIDINFFKGCNDLIKLLADYIKRNFPEG